MAAGGRLTLRPANEKGRRTDHFRARRSGITGRLSSKPCTWGRFLAQGIRAERSWFMGTPMDLIQSRSRQQPLLEFLKK
jgi:hypothetical protein